MKKAAILFLVLFLTACSKDKTIEVNVEPSKLMKNFPSQVVTYYKLDELETNSFSRRDNENYTIGKDIYSISFKSSASAKEVSKYYQSLMSEVVDKNKEWFDEYFFSGIIKTHKVNISIVDKGKTTDVTITIGLREKDYTDKNPYFNLDKNIIEIYGMSQLQEETYEENHRLGEIRYMTIYQTDKEKEEYINFYKNLYSQKDQFNEESDDYGTTLTWTDGDYNIEVYYDKAGEYKFSGVIITKNM